MTSTQYYIKKKWFRMVFIGLPVIALINLVFPFILKGYVNRKLSKLKKLFGHADRIQIEFGTLIVHGFVLDRLDAATGGRTKFLSAKKAVITFKRKQLWNGIAEADVSVTEPVYTHMRREQKPKTARVKTGITHVNIFPFIANKVEVTNGIIEYIDMFASPLVRLDSGLLQINSAGVSNMPDFALPAQVNITGNIYGGEIIAGAKVYLQKTKPSFDVNLEAKNIELNKLNNFFEAYGKFTVNHGTMALFTEIAAADGKYKGYVKPLVTNIDIIGNEGEKTSLWRTIWEGVLGTAAKLLENTKEEQLATKIPIEGEFKDGDINVWAAIMQTLRNAFICALTPSIDYTINLNSVKEKSNTK